MSRHPDVNLLEPHFDAFLEFHEELSAFRQVGHVDGHADEVVAVGLALMAPESANRLRFGRDGAEALLQFE